MELRGGRIVNGAPDPPPPPPPPPVVRNKKKRPREPVLLQADDEQPTPNIGTKRIRCQKRGEWSKEAMEEAQEAIDDGLISIRGASRHYGIPQTTLRNWLYGRTNDKQGPKPKCLKEDEERELVEWVHQRAKEGRGVTVEHLCKRASDMAAGRVTLWNQGVPGRSWWRSFKKRHPDVVMRTPEPMDTLRVKALNTNNLAAFYTNLKNILEELQLPPDRIWNCDETGIMAGEKKGVKILAKRGHPVWQNIPKNREWITALVCINAAGCKIPSCYIFKGKTCNNWDLVAGCEPSAAMGFQKHAWVTEKFFDKWIGHFKYRVPGGVSKDRPHLLICDGHGSHVNLQVIEHAREIGLHILQLPPHTSHALQPLDVSCFGPFKKAFRKVRLVHMDKEQPKDPNRSDMAAMVSKSLAASLTPENIKSGFEKTGIWPFQYMKVQPSEVADKLAAAEDEEDGEEEELEDEAEEAGQCLMQLAGNDNLNNANVSSTNLAGVQDEGALNVAAEPHNLPQNMEGQHDHSNEWQDPLDANQAAIQVQLAVTNAGPQKLPVRRKDPRSVGLTLQQKLLVTSDDVHQARLDAKRASEEAERLRKERAEERKRQMVERALARAEAQASRAAAKAAKEAQKISEARYEMESARWRSRLFTSDGKCRYTSDALFGPQKAMSQSVREARARGRIRLLMRRGLQPICDEDGQFVHVQDHFEDEHAEGLQGEQTWDEIRASVVPDSQAFIDSQVEDFDDETVACTLGGQLDDSEEETCGIRKSKALSML